MFAVEIQNVSKIYRVYNQPADRLKEILLRRRLHTPFYGVQNISLSVSHGDVVGIIGDNGAGKSTLLKLLAGTLSPTTGEIRRNGRVAALLELGAGFHPEFTGLQNIHLNAALLGLSEAEIKRLEPEIIAFSELGEFIHRRVKTYSSGMYVRLAFAIATSVDPDILIIDEALSVGDGYFQKKCVNRITNFKLRDKTILFCSHNMYLVRELCTHAMWIQHGKIQQYGTSADVVGAYLGYLQAKQAKIQNKQDQAAPLVQSAIGPEVVVTGITVLDARQQPVTQLTQFAPLRIVVHTRRNGPAVPGHLGVVLLTADDQVVFAAATKQAGFAPVQFSGEQQITLEIPSLPLGAGRYYFKAIVGDESGLRIIHAFRTETLGTVSERPEFGILWIAHEWHLPEE